MRALTRVYAGWGFSQAFYKQELYRQMGFARLEDFVAGFWEKRYATRDANNLLSMLRTWELNDVSATPGFDGSLERALGAIKAKATVMASETDLYFTPVDIQSDAEHIPGSRFRIIPSLWVTWPGPVSTGWTRALLRTRSTRYSPHSWVSHPRLDRARRMSGGAKSR